MKKNLIMICLLLFIVLFVGCNEDQVKGHGVGIETSQLK